MVIIEAEPKAFRQLDMIESKLLQIDKKLALMDKNLASLIQKLRFDLQYKK